MTLEFLNDRVMESACAEIEEEIARIVVTTAPIAPEVHDEDRLLAKVLRSVHKGCHLFVMVWTEAGYAKHGNFACRHGEDAAITLRR